MAEREHNNEPNLISESGREGLTPADRVGLLKNALLLPPFNGIGEGTRAVSQTIHDLKLTVGWIRNTITLYERAIARGQTDETLAKGANWAFSGTECLILAWRRGGHAEWKRILDAQRELVKRGEL